MIVGYTYQSENLCGQCTMGKMSNADPIPGADAENVLTFVAGVLGVDRSNENSYNSDVFPKPFTDQQLEATGPCEACRDEGYGVKHCSVNLCDGCGREMM
jgi:hypothetical protein